MPGRRNHVNQLENAIVQTEEKVMASRERADLLQLDETERQEIERANARREESIEGYRRGLRSER